MSNNLETIKAILVDLQSLANQQLELLDRESYDEMAELVNGKSCLLTQLGEEVKSAIAHGLEIDGANRSNQQHPKFEELDEINERLRKFQALDKYIIQQVIAHKDVVGSKLQKIINTKSMSNSYFNKSDKPKLLDKAV